MNGFQEILVFVVVAPGVIFAAFAFLWLLGWTPTERFLSRITGLTFSACTAGVAALVWKITSTPSVAVTFGNWFAVGSYHFPLVLMVDRLSLPFLALTAVLSGLIGEKLGFYSDSRKGALHNNP